MILLNYETIKTQLVEKFNLNIDYQLVLDICHLISHGG